MLEDAENALNPAPLLNSLFGSGYPQCKQVTLPVGDAYGRIADDTTGESWISDPDTATKSGDSYVQTRWVQDTDRAGNPINLTKEQCDASTKSFHPDGTPISNTKESFQGFITAPQSILVIGVLCLVAYGCMRK
jgi:hypothetical protein